VFLNYVAVYASLLYFFSADIKQISK